MSKSSKIQKPVRKYNPLNDTRRFSDGVRLHRYVAVVLHYGYMNLRDRYPESEISVAEFMREAIPILHRLKVIALVDPSKEVPDWLDDRDKRLARRGGQLPIWMGIYTADLDPGIWVSVVSDIRNGQIVWSKTEIRSRERDRQAPPNKLH